MANTYHPEWSILNKVLSFAGAAGMALLIPFAILLVGIPIALLIRGLVELLRLTGLLG